MRTLYGEAEHITCRTSCYENGAEVAKWVKIYELLSYTMTMFMGHHIYFCTRWVNTLITMSITVWSLESLVDRHRTTINRSKKSNGKIRNKTWKQSTKCHKTLITISVVDPTKLSGHDQNRLRNSHE